MTANGERDQNMAAAIPHTKRLVASRTINLCTVSAVSAHPNARLSNRLKTAHATRTKRSLYLSPTYCLTPKFAISKPGARRWPFTMRKSPIVSPNVGPSPPEPPTMMRKRSLSCALSKSLLHSSFATLSSLTAALSSAMSSLLARACDRGLRYPLGTTRSRSCFLAHTTTALRAIAMSLSRLAAPPVISPRTKLTDGTTR
eukprot:1741497-Pleurochrysis_carterae.AAC.1